MQEIDRLGRVALELKDILAGIEEFGGLSSNTILAMMHLKNALTSTRAAKVSLEREAASNKPPYTDRGVTTHNQE